MRLKNLLKGIMLSCLVLFLASTSGIAFADSELVKTEADYILKCQFMEQADSAYGCINNVYGSPTWIVPRENAMAILGLIMASDILEDTSYLERAQLAADYLISIQQEDDGAWCDQYSYSEVVDWAKSPTQTAEVMIAFYKLGYREDRYDSMKKGAGYLISCQELENKGGNDDGLLGGGKDASGIYRFWRWASDNAYAYQALKAAQKWAMIKGDTDFSEVCDYAAKRIIEGIDEYLYIDDPESSDFGVWHGKIDENGIPKDPGLHEWINYAPQMLDLPCRGVNSEEVGEWIHNTLQKEDGAVVWNDGAEENRKSPGFSFQASLCWLDIGQESYLNSALTWAKESGLWQTVPDGNGITGSWIDWTEDGVNADWWLRFIDTSFYSIAAYNGGYDFNVNQELLDEPRVKWSEDLASVELNWDEETNPDFSFYRIYRTATPKNPASWVQLGSDISDAAITTFTDNDVAESGGIVYYYRLHTYYTSEIDSTYSDMEQAIPIIYVDANSASVEADGSKDNPYKDLKDLWKRTTKGTKICVAQGTYVTSPHFPQEFILLGGYESTNWTRNIELCETIIEGGIGFYNACDVVIDGVTITESAWSGVYVYEQLTSTMLIKDCKIIKNAWHGIRVEGSSNCLITIENCIVRENSEYGIYIFGKPSINFEIRDCQISENKKGGFDSINAYGNLFNNLLIDNTYAGIYCRGLDADGQLIIENNTIVGNGGKGGIVCIADAPSFSPIIRNNIITNNNGGIYAYTPNTHPTLSYNNICNNTEANYGNCNYTDGNIFMYPLFVEGPQGQYYLDKYSPCVDAGSDAAINLGFNYNYTTRTNAQPDINQVDMGYHYKAIFTDNHPPVLNEIADITVTEGQTITITPSATDPDEEDILTYSYSGWMIEQTYVTTFDDAGVHKVTVTVSDGSFIDSQEVTITVNDVNRAPILNPIGNRTIDENQELVITPSASDPDGEEVWYGWENAGVDVPIGAVFEAGVVRWTPTYDQAGGDYRLTCWAYDKELLRSNQETIVITVNNVDIAPPVVAITYPEDGAKIQIGTSLSFSGTATDDSGLESIETKINGEDAGVSVTIEDISNWSFVAGLVQTDTLAPGSTLTFEARAIDAAGNQSPWQSITVELENSPDTAPPTISIDPVSTPTNQDVTLTYTVEDDRSSGDKIVVTSDNDLPPTYTYTEEGDYTITLTATDEAGNSSSGSVSFTIDRTAPQVTITNPANNSGVNDVLIDISGTIDDDTATVEIEVTGANTNYSSADNMGDGTFSASGVTIEGEGQRNIVKVIATDAAGNEGEDSISVFKGWVLHIDLPEYYAEELLPEPYNFASSGAASAQMIIDLMRPEDDTPSQLEIYEYGHPYNKASLDEMDPHAIDYALGHFDYYDNLGEGDAPAGGRSNYGYNFGIEEYEPDQFKEYLRDITHWIAYPVTKEDWHNYQDETDLVAEPYTPAAVPAYGTYGHWLVINGAACDMNPYPFEPHSRYHRLSDLSNFTVYGLWLTDPQGQGIGQDNYLTAGECQATMLLPLTAEDDYKGKYLQVAEPPSEPSDAEVSLAEPRINESTRELVRIADYLSGESTDPVKKHLLDRALVVNLNEEQELISYTIEEDLLNIFKPENEATSRINWKEIIDPSLLTDEKFTQSIQGSIARSFIPVQRLDKAGKDYYLVPFDNFFQGQFLSYAAIIIDREEGYFKQASWVDEPVRFIQISKEEAIEKVLAQSEEEPAEIKAELVYSPELTTSPFYPVWRITTEDKTYYINQETLRTLNSNTENTE
ncbi:MAG: right-handed parallel beta-helix repeat-containing protein [Candidatus Omnitrophota bacterium]|nr:MAG: right-handed parallel beta-helix repeat-containing protein [Candidatus Omnitrophota bacterium]